MSKTRKMSPSFVKSQKLGRCSINNIIKYKCMDKDEKVDYIRHHHTYYDGSYEAFFSNGRPNSNRYLLNDIIYGIVIGDFLPDILTFINKALLRWIMNGKKGTFDLQTVVEKYDYVM